MGRQRNNPQSKGKEESSERMINEIEASQLSDSEFKQWLYGSSMSSLKLPKTTGKLQGT